MSKAKEEKKKEVEAPKLTLSQMTNKRSIFSGSKSQAQRGFKNFTPKSFRITQHKGG